MEAPREQLLNSYVLLVLSMLPRDLGNHANLNELIRQAINRVSLEINDEMNEIDDDAGPALVRTPARQSMHERIIAYIRNPQQPQQPQQQPQQPQQPPNHTGGLPHKNSQKRSTRRRRSSKRRQSRKMNKRRR